MNLPNVLTLSRIALTFLFLFFITQPGWTFKALASLVFLIASLTDFYDGYYARKHQLFSDFGKIMDPVADKVLILASFFVFLQMRLIAGWMFALILIREVLITVWRLLAIRQGKVLGAERAGKIKTVSQITAISFILIYLLVKEAPFSQSWPVSCWQGWRLVIQVLVTTSVALTLFSGAAFVKNNLKFR